MEAHYINITESLSLLEMQEEEYQSIMDSTRLKDHIISLKLGLLFLKKFLRFSNNEGLKKRIKYVVYNVWKELYALSKRPKNESLTRYLGSGYSNLCKKMKNVMIEPQTREYDVIWNFFVSETYFKKINDFLLDIFVDFSRCKHDLIGCLMEEIEDIKEKLTLLKPLLIYLANRKVHIAEENKKLLTPFVAVLDKAACLFFSCLFDKKDEETALAMKRKLSDLQRKIDVKEIYMMVLRASNLSESKENHLESEIYLLENQIWLLDCNIYLNDSSSKLHEELNVLKTFLSQKIEKFNYLRTSIEAITCSAIPILYSCIDKNLKEGMVREVDGALSEVLDQIKHIQTEVSEIKLNNFPKTDGIGFLDLLLRHLEELLTSRPELIETLKISLETLREDFNDLTSFLQDMKAHHNENQVSKELSTRIIGMAYQAEYIIDLYLVKDAPDSHVMFSLSKIIKQTKVIQTEVKRVYDEEKNNNHARDISETSEHVRSHDTNHTTAEVVVSFDEGEKIMEHLTDDTIPTTAEVVAIFKSEGDKIMEHLTGDSKQRNIVSICGMPGLGKTTLAKKIFEASSIVKHFNRRVWCIASQTYNKRKMLLAMLHSVIEVTTEISEMNEEYLASKLYQILKGRRYLVVIDDLWDINVVDDLIRSFPNDNNGSRILITSRLQNVASKTNYDTNVHTLRPLFDDESWELFQKRLFPEERIPHDLVEIGKKITRSCKGLPLSIVVITGVLAKMEKSVDKWKQIAESVSSHIFNDLESSHMDIINLSYDHLPDHLRSCFLYVGAFLEEKDISSCKLKWLCIAEGFVRDTEETSLEDVAEEYFNDLTSRSLLIATKKRSQGGAKAFRVHDVLRVFCIEKAKEENFLQVIRVGNGSKFSRVYDQRRLSIYCTVDDLSKAKPSGCSVRSLLHTSSTYFNVGGVDVSFIFQNFKLLRVLDLACINIGKYFSGIELLIHLRYLAFRVETNFIPSSITNLWNLQFFLVKANSRYSSKEVDVPDSLWDMVNLRHVHINHCASFNVQKSRLECSSLLENLETLSTPCLSYGEDAENLLRRLPKLQKLSCIFLDYRDDADEASKYPVLDFLDQLVSLKVNFYKSMERPKKCEFYFPPNLQKLTLLNFEIPWESISEIGRTLPNLKVLKLIGWGSYGKWIVDDGDFPELRYLKLKYLRFDDWIASEGSFQALEQLVVDDCSNLSQIPPSIGEIPTLLKITVRNCEPSVDNSVMSIKNEQEDYGNEVLKVSIYPNKRYSEETNSDK